VRDRAYARPFAPLRLRDLDQARQVEIATPDDARQIRKPEENTNVNFSRLLQGD
jgi:hypothetical protein